jgi:hypothetical protein
MLTGINPERKVLDFGGGADRVQNAYFVQNYAVLA